MIIDRKEQQTGSGKSGGRRRPPQLYVMSAVAAIALLVALPAGIFAIADAAVLSKNEEPSTLTPNQKAIGLPDFTYLVQRVKPAVVSVRVKQEMAARLVPDSDGVNPFKDTPLEKFFQDQEQDGVRGKPHRSVPVEAQGSGFFIAADGYIVTNNHVVDHASEVEVVTDGGDTLKAKVIGTDQQSDLAMIKVDSDKAFPFVTLAKEKPQVGEWVVAMGNPFGLGGTVTAGIISAEGRDIGEGPYDDFLQIDAPINRGNSGGPTFNLKGEVIGVNTAIYSPSGGSVGIAFDIPASTVETLIPQLQNYGHVTRGWLGVQIQPVTKEIADSLGMKNAEGALITVIQPNSPASEAGLRSGDVITAVGNDSVRDARALARKIAGSGPGTEVSLAILRDGQPQTLSLRLGQMKQPPVKQASNDESHHEKVEKLGLALAPAREIEGAGSHGLAVVGVEPGSEAASLGMNEGDVILKAGGKAVSTPSEFKAALRSAKEAGHSHALVLLKHENNELYVAVPVAAG
jgi:serine protease Do